MPVRPTTRLSRADLADLNAFLAVERCRSFTQAAVELGITASAISHSVRNLETRLGVRLLNRTSRTVSATDAGTRLAKRLEVGFEEISGALIEVDQHRDRPVGRLRINALSDGARLLLASRLPTFLANYPDVSVEIAVDDKMVDIVAAQFDAGIRFGGTIPTDFVAVRIGEPLRWVAVAAPKYLARTKECKVPADLSSHNCIQIRTGQGVIYRWEFECGDEKVAIDVPGQLCVNETTFGVEMALAGCGVFYCLESRVSDHLAAGRLQIVLPDWAPIEPPFYLYYPGHRQAPPGLRELIETLQNSSSK